LKPTAGTPLCPFFFHFLQNLESKKRLSIRFLCYYSIINNSFSPAYKKIKKIMVCIDFFCIIELPFWNGIKNITNLKFNQDEKI
jgi:hypothetical protein